MMITSNCCISIILEKLELNRMPKLKGWWRGNCSVNDDSKISMLTTTPAHPLPSFPRLSKLTIKRCPDLMSFPLCSSVETLRLTKLHSRFGIRIEEEEKNRSGKVVENSTSRITKGVSEFQFLVNLEISWDHEVESVSEFEEVFRICSSSLKSLTLFKCRELRSVSEGGGLEYLTALEHLMLSELPKLKFEEREEMPWRSLGKSLHSLELYDLEKVDKLPKGMRYLISLKSLEIRDVPLLKEIPEWIECLLPSRNAAKTVEEPHFP